MPKLAAANAGPHGDSGASISGVSVRPDAATAPRLVGRARELSALIDAATAAPCLVLIAGEAGIGKSALVREAVADPRLRAQVLTGNCHRLREPFPLGPVLEALCDLAAHEPRCALSPVVGALQPLLPELAGLLPARPAPLGNAGAERHRIFRALRELLGAFGPLVCVLEDLHWSDESTLELLEFIARDPPPDLALVLTYRRDELTADSSLPALASGLSARAPLTVIDVPPLSVADVGRLTARLLGSDAVSPELARHLHEQTAGIPFALEEIVRMHGGQLALVDGWRTVEELDPLGVPPAVRQSLRERMATLPADARRVTAAVAVLATAAPEPLIAKVAGVSTARAVPALGRALSIAVLEERPDGRYGFLHALAAQAVYDEIPRPERRLLHGRAAQALQDAPGPPPLAQLAHHFREAGQVREWARHAEQAADAAAAIGDDRAAARLLEQVLDADGPEPEVRRRIAAKLGQAALYSASPQRALGLLEGVLDEQPVVSEITGELRYRIARLRYQTGDTGPWREELRAAIEELHHRPDLAARAMVTLSSPVVGQGPVEDDLAWLQRAVRTAERVDDRAVRITVAGQRAVVLLCVADPAGWHAVDEIPRGADTVAEKLALLRAYLSLAGTAIGPGHFARAAGFLREVEDLMDELPHVAWQPWSDSAHASLDWRTGRWDGLQERLRVPAERGTGGPALAIGNELILAALLLARGRVRDAEQSFRSIRERAVVRGWMGSQLAAAAGLARILLARGDAGGARDAAAAGIAILERKRLWIWGRELVPVAVQALLAVGDRAGAATLARRFGAGVTGRDSPGARASAHVCEGLLAEDRGQFAAAARELAAADAISAELPAPYQAAAARAARGRCLLAGGDRDGGAVLLSALQGFEELGATWDATQVRAHLRSHEIAPPARHRGGRRSYGDALSPREAEVAQLAGLGHKNREIAESLFISRRTVETHVAAALRKLGATSRDELGAALAANSVTKVKNQ